MNNIRNINSAQKSKYDEFTVTKFKRGKWADFFKKKKIEEKKKMNTSRTYHSIRQKQMQQAENHILCTHAWTVLTKPANHRRIVNTRTKDSHLNSI